MEQSTKSEIDLSIFKNFKYDKMNILNQWKECIN